MPVSITNTVPENRTRMRPPVCTVCPTTMACACWAASIASTSGRNESGSCASPRYHNGPSSRAVRLSSGAFIVLLKSTVSSRRTVALIVAHGSDATAGLIPPWTNTTPLIRTTASRLRT